MRYKQILLLAGILIFGSAGCRSGERTMTFLHPQNVCVGRLRMTVPGLGVTRLFSDADINGVDLKWTPVEKSQSLDEAWQVKMKDISSKYSQLTKMLDDSPTRKGAISHAGSDSTQYLYLWQNFGAHILKANTYSTPDKVEMATRNLYEVIGSFAPGEMDSYRQNSFCVDGGAVNLPPQYGESTRADVVIPFGNGAPNQSFTITTFKVNAGSGDDVVKRHQSMRAELLLMGKLMHILQIGKRTVAGMQGHEAVVWMDSDKSGTYMFSGEFAFGGLTDSSVQPNASIIFSGTDFPKSIRPEQLLSLWNTVLDSMLMEK
jgi:hypothetical protein